MESDPFENAKLALADGSAYSFGEKLDSAIPPVSAGCYTIWDDVGRFIYAGMAGRTLTVEQIEEAKTYPSQRPSGLRERLGAQRSGRRSGDQFAVYVFDRLVLPALTTEQIAAAAGGKRSLGAPPVTGHSIPACDLW